jgi:hypothetical protein
LVYKYHFSSKLQTRKSGVGFGPCYLRELVLLVKLCIGMSKREGSIDALSNLCGWLTGAWRKQNSIGKALLSCTLLLVMACVCGVPLLWLALFEP